MKDQSQPQSTPPQPTKLEKYVYEKVFKPPIYLYTYDGRLTANIKQLKAYDIVTEDQEIQKTDILFALSAANFTAAKSGIRIDKTIQAQNLRTAIKARERPIIANTKQLRKGDDKPVKVVMRSGHILRGKQFTVGQYNLVLRIGGKVILLYRHSILEYTISDDT